MANHILLVEDSRTQALRFQLELKRHGLESEVASSGPSGLEAAQQRPPAVVLLDVDLPGLDGYGVCRALKADPQTAHIPVLMLTRRDEAHDTLAGLEVGAVDYIPKDSFAEVNLIAALRELGILG